MLLFCYEKLRVTSFGFQMDETRWVKNQNPEGRVLFLSLLKPSTIKTVKYHDKLESLHHAAKRL